MKKKIGTVMESDILVEAKQRAAREGRPLAEIIQNAMISYLHEDISRVDALRAWEKFCSHGSALDRQEIDDLLQEDALAL